MAISDELSDEGQAIMAFVRRHFEATGMRNALRVLDESEKIQTCVRSLSFTASFTRCTEDTDEITYDHANQVLRAMRER